MSTCNVKLENSCIDGSYYVFTCPHCSDMIQVLEKELNCCIFRHATYKDSMKQVNPHLPKEQCDKLILEGTVLGCCKPFRFFKGNDGVKSYVAKCDYI